MERRKPFVFRYLILFILLLLLCWMFPYTGDDWAWGSSIGLERLASWFDNYSGRYFGNLIVLLLTRSNLLKTLAMAGVLTGIIYFVEVLVQRRWAFYMGCIFLVLLPRTIFRQAVVWTAGFSNYAVSIFITLIYIMYIYPMLDGKTAKNPRQDFRCVIPFIVLGMASTLIVENMTLYNLVLAVAVMVFTVLKYHKIYIQHIAYFAGTVAGTVLMFSNSVYHSISNDQDGYRSIAQNGIIHQAMDNYLKVIYKEAYMKNIWLNLLILAVCSLIFYSIHTHIKNKRVRWILKNCILLMGVFAVFSVLSVIGLADGERRRSFQYLEAFLALVSVAAVFVFAVITAAYKKNFYKIFFLAGSIICMTAPLFVVTPIGSRNFFATYIMWILLACELCKFVPDKYRNADCMKLVKQAGMIVCIAGIIFYLGIFQAIYRTDRSRLEYIREHVAAGEQEIQILHLPYEEYLWTATPNGEDLWAERYKLFYRLPEDITLKDVRKYK